MVLAIHVHVIGGKWTEGQWKYMYLISSLWYPRGLIFFIQVANQNQSLKGLWAAKLNLEGRASLATPEDLALYETKLEELEIELERRKQVGHR